MKNLNITVANKIATYCQRDGIIVCGNSDYQITFTFDSEWDSYEEKTARFKWNGGFYDVTFTGDAVAVPTIENASQVEVGVYVENLSTTTSAVIPCQRSILCGEAIAFIPPQKALDMEARISKVENSVKIHDEYSKIRLRELTESDAALGSRVYALEEGVVKNYRNDVRIECGEMYSATGQYAAIYLSFVTTKNAYIPSLLDLLNTPAVAIWNNKCYLNYACAQFYEYDNPDGECAVAWVQLYGDGLRVAYLTSEGAISVKEYSGNQIKIASTETEV